MERKAFSLVELLVVIAIIALLAALLLPVILRGKSHAQSAACKNHLRQIGLGLAIYLSDSHRYPPMWGAETGERFQTWADSLAPNAAFSWTNRSWHCPTYLANKGVVKYRRPPYAMVHTSYSYNGYGIADPSTTNRSRLRLGLGGDHPRYSSREPEVLRPSEMFVVADSTRFRLNPDGEIAGDIAMIYTVYGKEAAPPHGQSYNILSGDGHVSLVKRSDYLYPPRTAPHWNRDNQPHPEVWAPVDQWLVQK